jgi:hypothetical protein
MTRFINITYYYLSPTTEVNALDYISLCCWPYFGIMSALCSWLHAKASKKPNFGKAALKVSKISPLTNKGRKIVSFIIAIIFSIGTITIMINCSAVNSTCIVVTVINASNMLELLPLTTLDQLINLQGLLLGGTGLLLVGSW